jgi:cytochrome c-type biogenesis protein CcmH/NrfF
MPAWLWIMIAVVVLLGVLNLVVRPRRRRQDEPDLEARPETDG